GKVINLSKNLGISKEKLLMKKANFMYATATCMIIRP
ncbi:phenylacetic acid degradation protein, partial [Acinetobacter baumannii]